MCPDRQMCLKSLRTSDMLSRAFDSSVGRVEDCKTSDMLNS